MSKFEVNQKVRFTGYTELEPGQDEVLTVGQTYTIVALSEDGGLQVVDSDGKGDTVFPEEVEAVAGKTTAAKKPKAPAKAAPVKAPAKTKTPAKKTTTKPKKAAAAVVTQPEPAKIIPVVAAELSPAITDSDAVVKLLESNDMLTAAKELAVSAEQTFISLGGVLSHIDSIGAHKTLGYDGKRGFADYMLRELNIQYRKGMYLIQIYNATRQYGLDEETVARIGWSKMKEIVSLISDENKAELIGYADEHTREELVAHVRKSYVRANDSDQNDRVLKTRLTFSLFGDQTETVQRALEQAKITIGGDCTPEQALVLITAEWSQVTESVEFSLEASLKTLELRHGVKLGVVTEQETAEEQELITA